MQEIKNKPQDENDSEYKQFRRMKREEEARANLTKIECDCLSPYIDKLQLKDTCKSAEGLALGGVVVFPAYVKACVSYLGKDPKCALIAEISYPHGLDTTDVKVNAVKRAIKDGVDEVEVCAPIQLIKDGNHAYFKHECKKVKKAAGRIPVRLVFDCSMLSLSELSKACAISADAGVHCVRLNNADGDAIATIKQAVRGKCLIKADGVESFSKFANYCVMGADYLGSKNAISLANLIKHRAEVE